MILDRSVKCSNFIGETIDMAADMGFKRMLLTGHMRKAYKGSRRHHEHSFEGGRLQDRAFDGICV